MWVAGYGPRALALAGEVGDGFILQLADPQIVAWTIAAVREGAERVGRDPDAITICVAAPAYVGDDVAHQRDQCRWFGGMVGNHVADIVGRYGDSSDVPAALTEYIKGRQGYDYNQHGQAGNTHADFVPDEIVDRFCILGPVDEHVRRLDELRRPRRRPVRHLPPARRQGRHPAGLRRARHPGAHRDPTRQAVSSGGGAIRKVAMFALSLVLVAAAWELYKLIGPADGGDVLGVRILPRANDTAMPHVWDMGSRLFDDREAAAVDRADLASSCCRRRGTRSAWRSSASPSAPRSASASPS